jgi:hypothetical protein
MKGLRGAVFAACCLPALSLGCGGSPGTRAIDGAVEPSIDGTVEPSIDAGAFPFTPSNLPAGALAFDGLGDLMMGAATCSGPIAIDTDALALSGCSSLVADRDFRFRMIDQRDGGRAALLLTRSSQIEVGTRVAVRGTLPLILAAADRIDVGGLLEAAALGAAAPAGGFAPPPPPKASGRGPGGGGGTAPGGGGAGSYCGLGGKGGPSSNGETNGGGARYGNATITPLAGGSSGGNAGTWEGGAGGGALQLVAGVRIAVPATGAIHAGGGGGDREGCGGGSGGAILLEAPSVVVGGVLAANGGGGGSAGESGHDAAPDDQPASGGGPVHAIAGEGGNGAAGSTLVGGQGRPNPDFVNGDFSGGGGGGAGWIRINGEATVTGILSPGLDTTCASVGSLRSGP